MFKTLLFSFLSLFLFCSFKNEQPTILVTIAPYALFAERIAGATIQIETLVPPGINMHIYEPTPKVVQASSKAKIWFRIDEPFERKIVRALKEINPQLVLVNLQEGLPLIQSEHTCTHHDSRDLHTWVSPKLARQQAKVIYEVLRKNFPENADVYTKNYALLDDDFQALDENLHEMLKPYAGEAVLTSHPALGYFCKEYDLVQLSVECEGKEPKPKDIERIMKEAKESKVRAVFLQEGYDNRGAVLIAKKLKLPIYRIDPYARDYFNTLTQIGELIGGSHRG